tara:strand:+ start:346 stop:576 length:231 start_codon:yes stop_codon:yes gene_type:complete
MARYFYKKTSFFGKKCSKMAQKCLKVPVFIIFCVVMFFVFCSLVKNQFFCQKATKIIKKSTKTIKKRSKNGILLNY